MMYSLTVDLIARRMHERGYGNNYYLKIRRFVLSPSEILKINAMRDFYYLAEENANIKIESHTGVYELQGTKSNELQYEHHGQLSIENKSIEQPTQVLMIQVIP